MKLECKKGYKGVIHTSQLIFKGKGFNLPQIRSLIKHSVIQKWNMSQMEKESKLSSAEVKIIQYVYQDAMPENILVTVEWQIV